MPHSWQKQCISAQGWGAGTQVLARAALCQTQSAPTGPQEGTAEPLSHGGGDCTFKKGKNCCTAAMRERSEKNVRGRAPQTLQSVKKEGKEVLHEEDSPEAHRRQSSRASWPQRNFSLLGETSCHFLPTPYCRGRTDQPRWAPSST